MPAIVLNSEQKAVARSIDKFLANPDPDAEKSWTTFGLAGTGKTTLLAQIMKPSETHHLVTITGKAAAVLRAKGCASAQTVCSLFYNLSGKEVAEDGKVDLFFKRKKVDGAFAGHVVYLDECSMVSALIANDLLRSGAKIVAFGDPGQLPPVNAQKYFEFADAELQTIHRQALESPIIRQAHHIRRDCTYEADGPDFRVVSKVSLSDMAGADMVLCFMRRTADKMNAAIRKERGFNMPYPMAGEKLLCLKNAPKYGLYNGAIYELVETFPHVEGIMVLMVDGQKMYVPKTMFNAKTDKVYVDDDCETMFSYANCLTVHKAQGSEWDKVVLIDECRQGIRREWLYTGTTRAAKSIIVQG